MSKIKQIEKKPQKVTIRSSLNDIIKLIPGIIILVSIIILIRLLRLNKAWQVILFLFLVGLLFDIWKHVIKKEEFVYNDWFKNKIEAIIMLSIIYGSIYYFGGWGIAGLIIIILLLVVYKLYRQRDIFMSKIKDIETTIWGKPLDKEEWKGEKLPKLKLRLGGKQ